MKIIPLAKAIKCGILGTTFLSKQGTPLGGFAAGELKQLTFPSFSGSASSLLSFSSVIRIRPGSAKVHVMLDLVQHSTSGALKHSCAMERPLSYSSANLRSCVVN